MYYEQPTGFQNTGAVVPVFELPILQICIVVMQTVV